MVGLTVDIYEMIITVLLCGYPCLIVQLLIAHDNARRYKTYFNCEQEVNLKLMKELMKCKSKQNK